MKFFVLVPDGLADDPREELGGKTPVEAASTPNLDRIARGGRVGQVKLIPRRMPPGSDVANLAVLGYNPKEHYTGRAPLEAASRGIRLGRDDWALRCNLVTVSDRVMADYSAGHISTREATLIIDLLNEKLGATDISFHPGVSYRNLLILRNRPKFAVKTVPPHDISGKPIADYLPARRDGKMLRELMESSARLLADHEVNRVRLELGENPANMIWLWGEGQAPELPSFRDKFGKRAALISAVDLLKGLAVSVKMDVIVVPGATGYYDTDYAAKGKYACEALREYDLVFVHVEAPDEASHDGDLKKKIAAIENIDRHILGPVLKWLQECGQPFRMLVLPDHATPIAVRTHTDVAVPFAMYGTGVESPRQVRMSEAAGKTSDLKIDPGYELMGYFLGLRG
jgi:2,3-bisphosphoglycerate-independent phosphoglycerate mutase